MLNAFYHRQRPAMGEALRVPIGFEIILKTITFCDVKTHKEKRASPVSKDDRNAGCWTRIDALQIPDNTAVKVWLKDLAFPLLLTKQVFTNKNQSTGVRFLVSNDFDLSDEDFTAHHKKRWSVEEYHKSLKQQALRQQNVSA